MSLFNLHGDVFWLWLSGAIFLVMTIMFIAGPLKKERNELMYGILGFLGGMAWFHIFLGAGMLAKIPLLNTLAMFGAVTGSAVLFKFPLTSFASPVVRKIGFYLALGIGWLLVVGLILFSKDPIAPMKFGAIYMIVVSGLIAGSYFIWKGFTFKQPGTKIKCIGGGCSIFFCCFITHLIVLTAGMTALAKVFMLLTPVTAVLSVIFGHLIEKNYQKPQSTVAPNQN